MRSLLLFLIRYNNFFFLLLFEALSVILIVRNKQFHRASFLNSTNLITGNIYNTYSSFKEYLNLSVVNEHLANENARLHQMLKSAAQWQSPDQLNSDIGPSPYVYIAAKVINNSVFKANNIITINKGSADGIKPNMGVICADGMVGIVNSVSKNFATIVSLLNQDVRISAKLLKQGNFGSLQWQGTDPTVAILYDIPKNISVEPGSDIVSSGYSSFFPENIQIGKVSKAELEKGSNFYKIEVALSTKFDRITYVYIINYILKNEQMELEKEADE
ncbi:MAG: rod shape-determining protein MreC [Bacteroidetes bacterium]|nr:rod shape-determining protein MreC [Bacteroidota bacterium]